jgi:hypothetical protein
MEVERKFKLIYLKHVTTTAALGDQEAAWAPREAVRGEGGLARRAERDDADVLEHAVGARSVQAAHGGGAERCRVDRQDSPGECGEGRARER